MKHVSQTVRLKVSDTEPFMVGKSDLEYFLDRPHRLKGGGVLFCTSGRGELSVNMKSCTVGKNTQVIMLPNDLLMLIDKDADFEMSYLFFTEQLFSEACFRISSDLFGFLRENFSTILPDGAIEMHHHFFALTEILYEDKECRFRNKIAVNCIQSYFLNSYDKIFRLHTQKEIKDADRKNELFKRFVALVHTHCTRQREVSFYANELAISSRYLTAITQKNKKSSAKTFIDNAVLQEIKLLLHTSDLSIQEIADRLNFPDQSYLGRFFKKHAGISPKEYRKRQ